MLLARHCYRFRLGVSTFAQPDMATEGSDPCHIGTGPVEVRLHSDAHVAELLLNCFVDVESRVRIRAVFHVYGDGRADLRRSTGNEAHSLDRQLPVKSQPQLSELHRHIRIETVDVDLVEAGQIVVAGRPGRSNIGDRFTEMVQRCRHPTLVEFLSNRYGLRHRLTGNEPQRELAAGLELGEHPLGQPQIGGLQHDLAESVDHSSSSAATANPPSSFDRWAAA